MRKGLFFLLVVLVSFSFFGCATALKKEVEFLKIQVADNTRRVNTATDICSGIETEFDAIKKYVGISEEWDSNTDFNIDERLRRLSGRFYQREKEVSSAIREDRKEIATLKKFSGFDPNTWDPNSTASLASRIDSAKKRQKSLQTQVSTVRSSTLHTRDLLADTYDDVVIGYIVGFKDGESVLVGDTLQQAEKWVEDLSDASGDPSYSISVVSGLASPALTQAGKDYNERLGFGRAESVINFFKKAGFSVPSPTYGGETLEYDPRSRKKNQRVMFRAEKII